MIAEETLKKLQPKQMGWYNRATDQYIRDVNVICQKLAKTLNLENCSSTLFFCGEKNW